MNSRTKAPAHKKKTGSGRRAEDRLYAAVASRDASCDGTFYYSVATTGVYCRPSCPARRPKRENIGFHASCADAEAAGFRPCKRCRPDATSLAERHAATVARACRTIETAEEPPTLAELAREAGLSRYHFLRLFKAAAGVTPKAYAAAHRIERVRASLNRSRTVTEAIHDAGFNSSGRFYAASTEALGMTPSAFRNGGYAITLRFAVASCSLGALLVAASEKGVAAILMGDEPEPLLHELERRFPKANLVGADRGFEDTVAKVVHLIDNPGLGLDLPLDIQGTAFQHRVWQALRKIPPGTTLTYAELAKRIGSPKAVRAVASACAANRIAVAIPCHRVVGQNGALSGYRWGIIRKQTLIERETKS